MTLICPRKSRSTKVYTHADQWESFLCVISPILTAVAGCLLVAAMIDAWPVF